MREQKKQKRRESRWFSTLQNRLVTPLGLEPRMSEPKSEVLPITPRGKLAKILRFFVAFHNCK